MSFRKVKPIQPELFRLRKKRDFMEKGQNLLEIKREQLLNSLKETYSKFIDEHRKLRKQFRETFELLKKGYERVGKNQIATIAYLNQISLNPEVDITYYNKIGIDVPKITLKQEETHLPNYSMTETPMHLDIITQNLREILQTIIRIGEMDSIMYHFAHNFQKIQRRIDALKDIVIPRTDEMIRFIEEILEDNTLEEHIQLKKIKEFLENKEVIQE